MSEQPLLFGASKDKRRPSLVEEAYAAVKGAIQSGVFPPGFGGSELEIAHRLGMSRTPVHQAIVRLEVEGMVELKPKRGVVISALSPTDMREVYDVVIAVEGMAARLVAEHEATVREEVCRTLVALNRAMSEALSDDDLIGWADHDVAFHASLVAGAGNGRLERIANMNIDQSFRARRATLLLRPKPSRSIADHDAIIAAIRAGDGVAAGQAAQSHKIAARDLVIGLLENYNMRYL